MTPCFLFFCSVKSLRLNSLTVCSSSLLSAPPLLLQDTKSGVSDGQFKEVRYFTCPPKQGMFVKMSSCFPDTPYSGTGDTLISSIPKQTSRTSTTATAHTHTHVPLLLKQLLNVSPPLNPMGASLL